MYKMFLGGVLMPVTPDKIAMKINGKNKTIELINEGDINNIKPAGLTEISFELLLPHQEYGFAQYEDGYKAPNFYLELFELIKVNGYTTQYILERATPNGTKLFGTNITVTIEEYTITESADNQFDITVSMKLKQYRSYGTKVVKIVENTDTATSTATVTPSKKTTTKDSSTVNMKYTVKSGDTLWGIAKKYLGDGSKCWNLAKLNNISNPNKIYVGQVITIKDVKSSSGTSSSTSSSSSTKSSGNTTSKASYKKKAVQYTAQATVGVALSGASLINRDVTGSSGYNDNIKITLN